MNPMLPAHVIDKALAENAPKARAEFLNIWREDLSDFIPIDVIDACSDWGISERLPLSSSAVKYIAWADAAGGTGKDSFALAMAHRESKDRVVVSQSEHARFDRSDAVRDQVCCRGETAFVGPRAVGEHHGRGGIVSMLCANRCVNQTTLDVLSAAIVRSTMIYALMTAVL
jgi:hypothetical protein